MTAVTVVSNNTNASAATMVTYTVTPTTNGNWYALPTTGSTDWVGVDYGYRDALEVLQGKVTIPKRAILYELPDGSKLTVDEQGNFHLCDKDAKVIYRANRMREFNPYVNASDQLARFIRYVGGLGLGREEVGTLPISLFVNWLVLEAAQMDGDPVPAGVVPLPKDRQLVGQVKPRCPVCQRYVRRVLVRQGLVHCGAICAQRHYARLAA